MTLDDAIKAISDNQNLIIKRLKISQNEVDSWIKNPVLLLDLGIITIINMCIVVDIDLIKFLEMLEREFPIEAWNN